MNISKDDLFSSRKTDNIYRLKFPKDEILDLVTIMEFRDEVRKKAKGQMSVQRYKGLGEMNPEQLWETTMDPEVRRLVKLTLDDVPEADHMFTLLMGDEVQPRRNYIEKHALEVTNLDV